MAHAAATTATIPGPVYLCGAEEMPGLPARACWNRLGPALNGGAEITVPTSRPTPRCQGVGTYKQLALVAGGALTGGGAVDVYYVPLETTPA